MPRRRTLAELLQSWDTYRVVSTECVHAPTTVGQLRPLAPSTLTLTTRPFVRRRTPGRTATPTTTRPNEALLEGHRLWSALGILDLPVEGDRLTAARVGQGGRLIEHPSQVVSD